MSDTVRLHPESIAALAEALAPAVAQLMREGIKRPTSGRLMTAAQVADRFGVARGWVYAHADELGAKRLGQGSKPRLRFDAKEVAAAMHSRNASGAPGSHAGVPSAPWSAPRVVPDPLGSLPQRWQEAVAAGRVEGS